MKALIIDVTFQKEYTNQFGTFYSHKVYYEDKVGYYSSKKKEQTYFVKDKEAEFTEELHNGSKGEYYVIKPVRQQFNSQTGRAVKKEQSRYSGFSLSYAKDLVVAGKIDSKDIYSVAKQMFDWMVNADRTLDL